MNKTVIMTVAALVIGVSAIAGSVASAGPAEDISAFQTFFRNALLILSSVILKMAFIQSTKHLVSSGSLLKIFHLMR